MERIFGFDIGTTSIGFAVIDHDPEKQTGTVLRLGARVFPEARDPDGTPLNQQRRQKRMMRRQLRRRRTRRRALNEALRDAGLLPTFSKEDKTDWATLMVKTDPYELRGRALEEGLEAYEIGRALYHLAQHRHFKGRELEENDALDTEADDEKRAKTERDSTLQTLRAEKVTLGAWLSRRDAHARKRGVHAHRSVVEDEFEKLWMAQSKYHAVLKDEELKAHIQNTIFAQRPVFWRKNTLGACRFMPGDALCPKGAWISQQRRMLEKLNNLTIASGNARPLDLEERTAILEKLQTQASMSWGGVRSQLKALYRKRGESGTEKSLRFNLELGGEDKLMGNAVEAKLAAIFGDGWKAHLYKQAIRDAVHQRLWSADYGEVGTQRVVILSDAERKRRRAAAAQSFMRDFSATEEQAAQLRELKFPTGWEPYSTATLQAFLPHLEEGIRFGLLVNGPEWEAWRNKSFPGRERPTGEILDRLPSPATKEERERIAQLRNPTVVRTQNELRKVVNNLIQMFGKPDRIRIEIGRDVGKSKRERDEIQSDIRKNENRRKDAIKDLESKGIANPSHDDVEKWVLWKESHEKCPYTGDCIGFDALFREGRYEVEHIWPRWRSFDNGARNKTLCRKDVNAEKSNKTPYEAFGHDEDRWAGMIIRLQGMTVSKGGVGISPGKVKRFLAEKMPEDFASRQLNDTRYAAKQILAQLKRLWPDMGPEAPVKVEAVTGQVTAQLRKLWTLNNILADNGEKTRADHRHHTVDALAVACTHPGMTNKLSRYWQQRDNPHAQKPTLLLPWESIRADAEKAVADIVVSHRVRKKVSGPLHDEMPLGYVGKDITKNGASLGIYVKRVPVGKLGIETLKITHPEEISRSAKFVVRDNEVRKVLLSHLQAENTVSAKAYPPYPRVSSNGPEIRTVRVLTTQQKDLMRPAMNGFVDPANNHHIAIYRLSDGKADFQVVSLYDAAQRLSQRKSVVQRQAVNGATFMMSLSPGDAIQLPDGNKKGIWIVQGAWASGQVVLVRHNDARPSTKNEAKRLGMDSVREEFYPTIGGLIQRKARKISIDPIGRIRPAND